MIDPQVAAFLQEGLGIHIGTRDDSLQPEGARALAVEVEADGLHILLYVAEAAAVRILPNLRTNGQAAIAFARPVDDRACQLKGTFVGLHAATEAERPFVVSQWEGFLDQLGRIGIPRTTSAAWTTWPAVALRIRVTALFDQTPGTKAGTPLA